jgi:exopolysaccharide biosynthesis polyprenyl glycosylphosphotransferase
MIRVFHHYFSGRKLILFLVETVSIALACLAGAVFLAFVLARSREPATPVGFAIPKLLLLSAAFVCAFQFAIYLMDLYDLRVAGEDRSRGMRVLKAAGVASVAVGTVMAFVPLQLPGGSLLGGAMGAIAGTLLVRAGLPSVMGEPARVLVIGAGPSARWLVKALEDYGENAFRVCGILDPTQATSETGSDGLVQAAMRQGAKYVISTEENPSGQSWVQGLLQCRLAGLQVFETVPFCERVLRRVPTSLARASDFAFSEDISVPPFRRITKRAVDLVMAAILIVLAAPLIAVTAVAIKLDSPGPVLYRQERVGRNGRRYVLWKFRSMEADAERDGPAWAKEQDERCTRVGRLIRKTRIDEIPQVVNVLLGEMSFVGPRPERPVFVERLKGVVPFYSLREIVQPGITGWAQIRYPYGASIEDAGNKLEFDLYYIKHCSLFLDLAIMFHTVRHVLRARGAR